MGRITLQTVADVVGVSRMTVSNAFSRPDQLSDALRRRILEAADELGYAGPDPAGRALARGSAGSVGVLLTDTLRLAFSDEVAALFVGAVAGELEPTGLALTLFSTAETDLVVPARDVAVDGALVYSCDPLAPAVGWLARRRLPLVLVDQPPQAGVPSVNVDDRGGAAAAARHLVELGHRRVALLAPDWGPASHTVRQRRAGWLDVLHRAGIDPVEITAPHPPPAAAGRPSPPVTALLAASPRPTAALCYSDAIALQVVHEAHDAGVRVPEDLSVVGFDDAPLAARLRPALTTVHQDVAAKGRTAAALLMAALERRDAPPRARHVVLPTELVVRASTARPPRRAPRPHPGGPS